MSSSDSKMRLHVCLAASLRLAACTTTAVVGERTRTNLANFLQNSNNRFGKADVEHGQLQVDVAKMAGADLFYFSLLIGNVCVIRRGWLCTLEQTLRFA